MQRSIPYLMHGRRKRNVRPFFALYKEGLEQIKAAGQSLDTIEKAMLVLNQDGKLEEF